MDTASALLQMKSRAYLSEASNLATRFAGPLRGVAVKAAVGGAEVLPADVRIIREEAVTPCASEQIGPNAASAIYGSRVERE
jgi:hypothetical protein